MKIFSLTIAIIIIFTSSIFAQTPTNLNISNNFQLQNEEQVCFNPVDSNIIVANWRDFRLGYRQIGVGYSHDGGQSWYNYLVPPTQQYYGLDSKQSDPTLTVDAAGNFIMSVLDYDGFGTTSGSIIAFYKSTNNGMSWAGPVPVPNNPVADPNIFEDKQFITIDRTGGTYDGNIYCSWTRFDNPDRMMFVRSINGGASFEDTVLVGPTQTSTGCGTSVIDAGQFSIPMVSSNGDVHVFWQGYALDSGTTCSGLTYIKHVISTDGGVSFTYEDTVLSVSGYTQADGGINTYSQPVTDADITGGPFDGNIYMTFTNMAEEDNLGTTDVDFIKSTDNAVSWSDRIQVNDFEFSEETNAFHPWMVCNEEGILVCVFYDTRYDYPNNYFFDLSAAYSFDGGETFTTNHRISDVSSNPGSLASVLAKQPLIKASSDLSVADVAQPMAGLLGEYIGVTAFHDKMNAVWTDSRDGNSEVYTANWYLPFLKPRLVEPLAGNSYEFPPPTFRWGTSWKNTDDRYRLEVSTSSDFSSGVIEITLDTNWTTLNQLLAVGDYYWRVKAFKISTNDSTEYSNIETFSMTSAPLTCCIGTRGNFDMTSSQDVDIVDLLFLVDYMFLPPGTAPAPSCLEEADIVIDSNIDISDLLLLVDYMFLPPPALTLPDCPSENIYYYEANDGTDNYIGWVELFFNGNGTFNGVWNLVTELDPSDWSSHIKPSGPITYGEIGEQAEGADYLPIIFTFNEWEGIDLMHLMNGKLYADSITGTWEFHAIGSLLNSGTFKMTK